MPNRGMSVEGVRRRNLGQVLTLVHRSGARSRSQITAETGLNRSTVADLVGALVSAGLVREREPDPTRRVGRPSPVVEPTDRAVAIAVNPEVDAVELAVVALGGRVLDRVRIENESDLTPDAVADAVAEAVGTWTSGAYADAFVVGVGVAVPGLVRRTDGMVRLAPHLHWRNVALGDTLREVVDLTITIGNDATLGARAEHLFGAGRDAEDFVYLNGGASGIGGGLILNNRVYAGAGGYAGEWGHIRISEPGDRRTSTGIFEDEVNRARLLDVLELGSADDVTLAGALRDSRSDAVATEVDRQRRLLATEIGPTISVLNPSLIVVGGFLAMLVEQAPMEFLALVKSHALAVPGENVRIRSAELAENRLLIGAAEAAFDHLFADPLGEGRTEA